MNLVYLGELDKKTNKSKNYYYLVKRLVEQTNHV